jgi:lysophospholipase L1-like esterase
LIRRTIVRRLAGVATALLLMQCVVPTRAEVAQRPARWIARVDVASGSFGWPGSGLEFVFEGTRLSVALVDGGKNSLVVEGPAGTRRLDLVAGHHDYVVAQGLSPGTHRLRLTRRTEGLFGPTRFVEARTDGQFLNSAPPQRRVLVLGDSISAGYGIEGANRHCGFSADTENQFLTFGAVTARDFGAESMTLAASGHGLLRSLDGDVPALPALLDRAVPTQESPVPLPRERAVQAVVLHLGTNDFAGGRRPEEFEESYAALLQRLRQDHPDAFIYAAIGPMLGGSDMKAAETAIAAAVGRRRRAGETALRFLRFPPVKKGLGCDWHPNVKAHRRMAEILTAAIAEDLGWGAP